MKPRENSSGVNGKLVYLKPTGYLPDRKQQRESRSRRLRSDDGKPGMTADRSLSAGIELPVRSGVHSQTAIDGQIHSFETAARKKCLSLFQNCRLKTPSIWFQQYLEDRLLPAFNRIGFDDSLTKAFFATAAPAWELMGPIGKNLRWCHPNLIKELDEIRSGIVLKSVKQHAARDWFARASRQDLAQAVKDHMDPESLTSLLDNIVTSWIILPRVYRHLEKRHCRYLPAYLRLLDREKNAECLRIFVGIIIHFTANYALKFAGENQKKDMLTKILVSGYEAMFWKTLRCPPAGLEEIAVFENFLNWINVLQAKRNAVENFEIPAVDRMEAMRTKLFPSSNGLFRQRGDPAETVRFLVTLRHGSRGIQALLTYFNPGTPHNHAAREMRLPSTINLPALQSFFRSIKSAYPSESLTTRQFIRQFLVHLQSSFKVKQDEYTPVAKGCQNLLGFDRLRVLSMIRNLGNELNT